MRPGDVVSVPLGAREITGVVWADNPNPDQRLHNRLKDVVGKLDVPPLRDRIARLRRLGRRLHAGLARHGDAHDAAHGRNLGPERLRVGVRLAGLPPKRMTPARVRA